MAFKVTEMLGLPNGMVEYMLVVLGSLSPSLSLVSLEIIMNFAKFKGHLSLPSFCFLFSANSSSPWHCRSINVWLSSGKQMAEVRGVECSEWVQEAEEEETMKMSDLSSLLLADFLRCFSSTVQSFILFSIPDLFLLSILHPLRIYQGATTMSIAGSTVLMPRIVNSIQRICARGPTKSLDQQTHASKVSLCLKPHASEAASLHLKPHVSRSSLTIAKDVVTNMLAKGFDEKHQLSSKATTKVVSLDQKVGLSEKIGAGTILPLMCLESHASKTSFIWRLMRLEHHAFEASLRLKPHASEDSLTIVLENL
ncbi:hypothetical protein Fmac_025031 [Flemingia macrophylla]|uniref:Uncharacterized protein n=1 Tax=Flemingia macrophylla TaxID=520843 RepID=A0ABD1LR61_9FABA